MMLAGDCEGGKALYRSWARASSTTDPEQAAESAAAAWCEGDKLSQRDELLRAADRISQASIGQPKPTIAECKDWSAVVRRLEPLVKPKDASDYRITSLPTNFPSQSTLCFAQAGDCSSALATFKADFDAKYASGYSDPKLRESQMRLMYDGLVAQTGCKGKP